MVAVHRIEMLFRRRFFFFGWLVGLDCLDN